MAGISVESHATMKFSAALFMTFHQVKSLFDEGKQVQSSGFSCPEDPEHVEFKICAYFRGDKGLQLCVAPTARAVTMRRFHFTLYEGKKPLKSGEFPGAKVGPNEFKGTPEKFHTSLGLGDNVTWRVKCIVEYDGVSANTGMHFLPLRDLDLPRQMLKLLEDAEDADVKFIVGNETIKAHKNILIARSTYFKSMFQSGMQECSSKEILIDDVAPAIFKEMLKFIYSGQVPHHLNAFATGMLAVADRYGLDVLKKMCETVIGCRVTVDNVIEVLLLADAHSCPKLTERCIPLFKANVSSLKRSASWAKLKANPYLIVSLLENCF